MHFPKSLLCAALVALAVPAAAPAQTQQGTAVTFSGLKPAPGQPVEVTSDQLTVNQAEGTALFTGNVIVGQGNLRMTAPKVLVTYAKATATQKGTISRVDATGGVTLTDGTEAAEGQQAVYTVDTAKVVMTGDVVLTQGQNAMAGQRLDIDLNSGTGLMQGRVKTIFQPAAKSQP